MLTDVARVEGFRQAIEACVKAGDVVLDLGSGTGIFAILAARAGARIVYAVEAAEIVEIARMVCRENGVEGRVVFLDTLSPRVQLPELADVLITETIGNFGLDEGILGWVGDARRRFLKPGAAIVPGAIELWAVPVEIAQAYAREIDWGYTQSGIDFRSMRPFAVNSLYHRRIKPRHYLAEPRSLGEVVLGEVASTAFATDAEFRVTRPGELHGLGGWFSARLCEGVTVSNNPQNGSGSWSHVFLPFEAPIRVAPGDALKVHIACANNGSVWRWSLAESGTPGVGGRDHQAGSRFDHSTFFGSPGMASHLHRQALGHAPELNVDGSVTRFLLDRMDGTRSLQVLSVLAAGAFPDRFADAVEALEYVRALSAEFGS
jgi:protein arginine N-methyltransferase 1